MPQRIGVIGTFIRDTIVTLDGKIVESIGGLYHTVAYLAHLADADTAIQPLCYVGDDFYDTVQKVLTQFNKKIILNSLLRAQQPNTQVKLTYLSPETREEVTTPAMPALRPADIAALSGCDAVLVNLISGSDIELKALQTLRKSNSSPLIYLDLHSLALGIDETGKRYYRSIPDWPDWAAAGDILQMNEREAATVIGLDERATRDDLVKLGRRLVAEKVMACHITVGGGGSLLFYHERGSVCCEQCPPFKVSPIVDVIGCGDAFGAAFLVHFMRTRNFSTATDFANQVAGLNCAFMGSLTPEIFQKIVHPQLEEIA